MFIIEGHFEKQNLTVMPIVITILGNSFRVNNIYHVHFLSPFFL